MKDWLGQEYGIGDKVIYAAMSGRSVTMVLAEVVEIYRVFRNEDYEWQRLGLDEEAPFQTRWNRETRQDELTEERHETELRVSLKPLSSSRWKQHSTSHTHYIDSRTGKGIDPYRSKKHTIEGYWTHENGERVTDSESYTDNRFLGVHRYPYDRTVDGWTHTKYEFKPYVKKITDEGAKPVMLTVTENITKWNGPTP